MDLQILHSNLTNPTLLYFLLGVIAVLVKSDLEIPDSITKFISLYLLFSIGFKGGQELSHTAMSSEIFATLAYALLLAGLVPLYVFFLARLKMSVPDAGAVAATYGSVSAVTFVAAVSFLEMNNDNFGGHMVAVLALMEVPAIVMGIFLISKTNPQSAAGGWFSVLHHSLTGGSVLMVVGSLAIGYVAETKQAEGIKPFTTDIFKGFLAIFLLEMGMVSARRFAAFRRFGWFAISLALLLPLVNGLLTAYTSPLVTLDTGNRFMLTMLVASASYIAVPAAMRIAVPKADPGLYIPMALGITFPFNITVGMPLFYYLIVHS